MSHICFKYFSQEIKYLDQFKFPPFESVFFYAFLEATVKLNLVYIIPIHGFIILYA